MYRWCQLQYSITQLYHHTVMDQWAYQPWNSSHFINSNSQSSHYLVCISCCLHRSKCTSVLVAYKKQTTTTTTPFYSPLDFVQDYLGEPVPERQNQEGKTNLGLLEQEIVSGSGISWAICKSAPCPRQAIMPASHHSVFYRLDALPAAQPTASKRWRQKVYFSSTWLHISI